MHRHRSVIKIAAGIKALQHGYIARKFRHH